MSSILTSGTSNMNETITAIAAVYIRSPINAGILGTSNRSRQSLAMSHVCNHERASHRKLAWFESYRGHVELSSMCLMQDVSKTQPYGPRGVSGVGGVVEHPQVVSQARLTDTQSSIGVNKPLCSLRSTQNCENLQVVDRKLVEIRHNEGDSNAQGSKCSNDDINILGGPFPHGVEQERRKEEELCVHSQIPALLQALLEQTESGVNENKLLFNLSRALQVAWDIWTVWSSCIVTKSTRSPSVATLLTPDNDIVSSADNHEHKEQTQDQPEIQHMRISTDKTLA
ncbi:unnamed protein product [Timema podura]|uniref:Uncharacterized protein n=1 Tax=Timema podura TaxID=61482 RepID=A0ABN7NYX4_TIMPD|nr:unnamed protein product [Timema podura]